MPEFYPLTPAEQKQRRRDLIARTDQPLPEGAIAEGTVLRYGTPNDHRMVIVNQITEKGATAQGGWGNYLLDMTRVVRKGAL